ncbi:hypothetical protein PGQ11_010461 [Apiospora arundinis]|uniref:Uncharacterized protein n=1 Tax=Apiospora arundinis TaxID=335852 RepID=A0ABR2I9R4_9PEZI
MFSSVALVAAATAIFARGADAKPPFGILDGHDFDFTVTYKSGLTFSTSKPPTHEINLRDVLYTTPQLTFADPAAAAAGASSPEYLSFIAISRVPYYESLGDYLVNFPWIQANGTAADNGTLVGSKSGWNRPDAGETEDGDVRNATIHIWRQTPEMLAYLFGAKNRSRMPLFWQVAGVWGNITSQVDTSTIWRASIEFKVRNETGKARCDVDANGAKIANVSKDAICTTTATASPSSTAPASGGPTGTPGEPAAGSGEGGAKSSASKQIIDACRFLVLAPWLAMCFPFILGII